MLLLFCSSHGARQKSIEINYTQSTECWLKIRLDKYNRERIHGTTSRRGCNAVTVEQTIFVFVYAGFIPRERERERENENVKECVCVFVMWHVHSVCVRARL